MHAMPNPGTGFGRPICDSRVWIYGIGHSNIIRRSCAGDHNGILERLGRMATASLAGAFTLRRGRIYPPRTPHYHISMPNTSRTRRAGGERRIAVLEAVIEVLAERGYENTRFADVSATSGVAISTLQNYFGSREDMLIETMRYATDRELAVLDTVAEGHSEPWDRLVALIDRNLSSPESIHLMLIEFWRCGFRDPELRDNGKEAWTRYAKPFVRTVNEGLDAGVFTTAERPDEIVDLLLRTLAGSVFPRFLKFPARSIKRFRAVLLQQLAASLGFDADAQ